MEGINIQEIVRQAVREYIASGEFTDDKTRVIAREIARQALERAIELLDTPANPEEGERPTK